MDAQVSKLRFVPDLHQYDISVDMMHVYFLSKSPCSFSNTLANTENGVNDFLQITSFVKVSLCTWNMASSMHREGICRLCT